jgi:hypothetical protein
MICDLFKLASQTFHEHLSNWLLSVSFFVAICIVVLPFLPIAIIVALVMMILWWAMVVAERVIVVCDYDVGSHW